MSCVRFNGIVNQRVYFPTANLMFEIGMNINWVLNPKNSSKSYHGMTYNEKKVFITDNYKKSLLESDYLTLEQNKAFYEVIAENTNSANPIIDVTDQPVPHTAKSIVSKNAST